MEVPLEELGRNSQVHLLSHSPEKDSLWHPAHFKMCHEIILVIGWCKVKEHSLKLRKIEQCHFIFAN